MHSFKKNVYTYLADGFKRKKKKT